MFKTAEAFAVNANANSNATDKKDKTDCNNGNDKNVGNAKKCDEVTTTTVPPTVTTTTTVPPTVTTTTLPPVVAPVVIKAYSVASTVPFIKGVATNVRLTMPTGTAPFVWSGVILSGLTLSSDGVVTGKPTTAGVTCNMIKVKDAKGVIYSKALIAITAINQPLNGVVLPTMKKLTPITIQLQAEASTGPYVFSGVTPAGTKVGATGVVAGTPTLEGTSSAILVTKDAAGDIAIRIAPATVTL